jgi:hypothetical protein
MYSCGQAKSSNLETDFFLTLAFNVGQAELIHNSVEMMYMLHILHFHEPIFDN